MDFEISETLIIAVTAENIIYSISSNPKSDVKIVSVNISCTHPLWALPPRPSEKFELVNSMPTHSCSSSFSPQPATSSIGPLKGCRQATWPVTVRNSSLITSFFTAFLLPSSSSSYLESLDISFPHPVLLLLILSLHHVVSSTDPYTPHMMFSTKGLHLILNE